MSREFFTLVASVLKRGRLTDDEVDGILKDGGYLFQRAFTSPSADAANNYEALEQKGDASVNAFLVWYFYERFPQLDCPKGVPTIARLKIVYASKTSFARVAERLGFWPFIAASSEDLDTRKKSLLEDVLEAFIGATQAILDKRSGQMGFGFSIVCRILKSIFDEERISLAYEDLYDAKSRLKHYLDANKSAGKTTGRYNLDTRIFTMDLTYDVTDVPFLVPVHAVGPYKTPEFQVTPTANPAAFNVAKKLGKRTKTIAEAYGATKASAEQAASEIAIRYFNVPPRDEWLNC